MIMNLLRLPHGLVRRHLSKIERVAVATALSALLYSLLVSLPAYPAPWEVVIVTAVFMLMLWSPAVAYFAAVAAVIYPLYTVSIYLLALFLAIALLGQRIFIYNMGAVVLVLSIPWLAQAHLVWVVPLLGGLWWGRSGGAWIGILAALWGQVLFGMMGMSPDWLAILGSSPTLDHIIARFSGANSLETLELLVSPLAPNSTMLLYYLLQVAGWGTVGGLIGAFSERAWFQRNRPNGNILLAMIGGTFLAGWHYWLALWLSQMPPGGEFSLVSMLALNAMISVLLVGILEGLRDFFEHPLPVRRWVRQGVASAKEIATRPRPKLGGQSLMQRLFHRKPAQPLAEPDLQPAERSIISPMSIPGDLPKRESKKQPPDDLIKIELD